MQHSRALSTERNNGLSGADDPSRIIAHLEQQIEALQAEIAYRKEIERALAQRERELSDFLENATEGLHKVGPDGTILWVNKAELDLLGYTPEEYIGHSIKEFHMDRSTIVDMLTTLLRGDSLCNYPARLRCKDGSIKHVLVHSNAYFEDGKLLYTRCFTRDITDLQQRVAERSESNP